MATSRVNANGANFDLLGVETVELIAENLAQSARLILPNTEFGEILHVYLHAK